MANHSSAIKRIRSNKKKRSLNRLKHKSARNAIRDFLLVKSKKEASEKLPKLISAIDKLAKDNIIHKNKAIRLKSKVTKRTAVLA